ncbi:MAG TPA: tetratricopeptide repeat protein [Planctomycetota bacterium]|nr:tetratricopeptide repeat protein [Planctomycetota bacterium]
MSTLRPWLRLLLRGIGGALLAAALAAGCRSAGVPASAAPIRNAEQPDDGPAEAADEAELPPRELAAAAYAAGVDAEFSGDLATAAGCYRRAIGLSPGQPGYELRLGLVLVEVPESAAEGAAHLERAETLGARSFAVHQGLASHFLRQGDKARAAREFEKLLSCSEAQADPVRFEPVVLRVAFFLTTHYQAEGLPAEAARVQGLIVGRFPERADLRLERAKMLLAAGDESAARVEIAELERLDAKSADGSRLLAVHCARRGQNAEALRETDRAIARLQAGGGPDDRPGDVSAMRHFRADLLGRLRRFEEARRELDGLLAAAADEGERVDALVALAGLDRAAGVPADAERRLRAAIASGAKSARLHGALAEALAAAGRGDEAADCWRRAQALAPRDAYYRLALASLFEKDGRRSAAAAELRALLEIHQDNAEALNMLGYLYAQEGINLEEAADLVGRALTAEPKNAHFLDSLGWVRYRQGRVEEALGILERAAMNAPEPVIYEHLGDACYALGLLNRARVAWRRAAELDREAPGPKRKLERLKRD